MFKISEIKCAYLLLKCKVTKIHFSYWRKDNASMKEQYIVFIFIGIRFNLKYKEMAWYCAYIYPGNY